MVIADGATAIDPTRHLSGSYTLCSIINSIDQKEVASECKKLKKEDDGGKA